MLQSERKHPERKIERKIRAYPFLFLLIGVAIGMVLMVILFQYFEEGIKSWRGYSRLAFLPLGVYVAIALVLRRNFQHKFSRLLELLAARRLPKQHGRSSE